MLSSNFVVSSGDNEESVFFDFQSEFGTFMFPCLSDEIAKNTDSSLAAYNKKLLIVSYFDKC